MMRLTECGVLVAYKKKFSCSITCLHIFILFTKKKINLFLKFNQLLGQGVRFYNLTTTTTTLITTIIIIIVIIITTTTIYFHFASIS